MFEHDQCGKKVQLYSRVRLEDWMLKLPTSQRGDLIAANCDTSAGYVLKCCYTRNYEVAPTFKLKIAVGLDKASQGQVDFRDHVADRDDIDWHYVHKVLGQRLRAEAQAKREALAA